ncbi:MAG TPA: histidinol-phosphate transaminase [Gammaproteobacteria bacterium]|jgi:histidinol-phosphate aminotransferase
MHTVKPRPGILDIVPYVPGNADNADPDRVVYLASNESPLGASPLAIDAYSSLSRKLHRYPDSGSQELRNAIGAKYRLPPEQIICGNGSERLIDLLTRAYAGPGDEVLYSQYGFIMYPICAMAAGAIPVTAPERDFTSDVDALLAAVSDRTRIVFLANPNNPTGTYISATEVKRLRDGLPSHVLLVIDSAYAEYVEAADYSAGYELVDTDTANVVVLHTFSKIYGLAALRLGWAYCPPQIADVLNRIRGSFSITAPAQAAGIAALQDQEHIDKALAHNRQWLPWLSSSLKEMRLEVLPSAGNFVLTRFADAELSRAAHRELLSKGVILRPVAGYGLPEALRITVGSERENRICVEALRAFIGNV